MTSSAISRNAAKFLDLLDHLAPVVSDIRTGVPRSQSSARHSLPSAVSTLTTHWSERGTPVPHVTFATAFSPRQHAAGFACCMLSRHRTLATMLRAGLESRAPTSLPPLHRGARRFRRERPKRAPQRNRGRRMGAGHAAFRPRQCNEPEYQVRS